MNDPDAIDNANNVLEPFGVTIEELDGGIAWATRYAEDGTLLEVARPAADGTITLAAGSWMLRVRTIYDQRTTLPLEVK